MCVASKLTVVAASHTHAHAQARTYYTTWRHIVEDNLFIYAIFTTYINYSRLPISVTGYLSHRTKLLNLWLFLYPLDELLYMDFWNTIKGLKNQSLHSLCSENLKFHDDLENCCIVLALTIQVLNGESAKHLRYTCLSFDSRIYTTTLISPIFKKYKQVLSMKVL